MAQTPVCILHLNTAVGESLQQCGPDGLCECLSGYDVLGNDKIVFIIIFDQSNLL